MNELKLTSTCTRIKDIDWTNTIFVDKIMFDQNLFESHKARIDKVFANATADVREQQLQNILMRDTLFNKAMDKIVKCYDFKIEKSDLEAYGKLISANIPHDANLSKEEFNTRIYQIAEKLVQKELVFIDIAELYSITVDAKETMDILNEYNKSTGNAIEDITSDKTKLTGAVNALLEEKITAFIINKFDKNFNELQKNIQLDMEARQAAETQTNLATESSGKDTPPSIPKKEEPFTTASPAKKEPDAIKKPSAPKIPGSNKKQ